MTVLKRSNHIQKIIVFAALGFTCVLGFQNCSRIAVQDLSKPSNSKAVQSAADADGECLDCETRVSQGETSDGDILLPIREAPQSLYLCPQGTESSEKEKAAATGQRFVTAGAGSGTGSNSNGVSGTSTGTGNVSVFAYSSSSNGYNTSSIVQNGDVNTANIYQNGSKNEASVIQNGQENKACIVQIGGSNHADAVQAGATNYVGLNQDVLGTSRVVQNGSASRDTSAETCGCRVIDCATDAADSDPICQQGLEQKVITK